VGITAATGPRLALALGAHMLISATFGAGYGALRALAHVSVVPDGPLYGLDAYGLTLMGGRPGARSHARSLDATADDRHAARDDARALWHGDRLRVEARAAGRITGERRAHQPAPGASSAPIWPGTCTAITP